MTKPDNRPTSDAIATKLRSSAGRDFVISEIGHVPYPERSYPIVRLARRLPLVNRPTVCIAAGFHGEEPAGPIAIHKHIDEILQTVRVKKLNLILYPCANPWGYDRGIRNPPGSEATNWFTHEPKGVARESEIIKRDMEQFSIDYYLDLHEDDENVGLYLYAFGSRDLAKRVLNAMAGQIPIEPKPKMDDPSIANAEIHDGIVWDAHDGSSEDWMSHRGAKLSVCTETPWVNIPLPKRITAQTAAIREIFKIA